MSGAAARRRRLAGALPETVDALLVTRLVNVRWASGVAGSFGALLLARQEGGGSDSPASGQAGDEPDAVLATDGRYRLRAADEAPGLPLLDTRRPAPELLAEAARRGCRRVGFEAEHLTVAAYEDLIGSGRELGIALVACRHIIERLRPMKDPDELAALRRACEVTDAAFAAVLPALRPGVTERDIEWWLAVAMREAGADELAFGTIVASGPHAAEPHHHPGDRVVASGDFVTMDFGAAVGGMHADMTRTVVVGRAADWQRELYEQVRTIQAEMRAATVPGALPIDLETAAAERIRAAGYRPAHGLGHGVGLEIHEEPWLTPGTTSEQLRAGIPVTVEPGIYLDGRGGVRIEDTVLVTEAGCEPLTTTARDLLEV